MFVDEFPVGNELLPGKIVPSEGRVGTSRYCQQRKYTGDAIYTYPGDYGFHLLPEPSTRKITIATCPLMYEQPNRRPQSEHCLVPKYYCSLFTFWQKVRCCFIHFAVVVPFGTDQCAAPAHHTIQYTASMLSLVWAKFR